MMPGTPGMPGMVGMVDCAEAERRLHHYLDRELTPEEAQEIRMHLDLCENCRTRFRFEEKLKRLVRERGAVGSAPASLRARIRQRLRELGSGT